MGKTQANQTKMRISPAVFLAAFCLACVVVGTGAQTPPVPLAATESTPNIPLATESQTDSTEPNSAVPSTGPNPFVAEGDATQPEVGDAEDCGTEGAYCDAYNGPTGLQEGQTTGGCCYSQGYYCYGGNFCANPQEYAQSCQNKGTKVCYIDDCTTAEDCCNYAICQNGQCCYEPDQGIGED